jgi:AsmA protein
MDRLSLSAQVSCRQVNVRDLTVSELRFTAVCGHGVLQTRDLTLRAFGGQGSAVLRADFTAPVPSYQLHAALSKFRLGEFSRNFSQKAFGDGVMDFSTELTMAGKDADAMTRSSNGDASLHGTDLTLAVGNLDAELSQYRKTQHFNLVDLGGFLLAGPIGLAVTKGYDYAKIISSSGGSSRIQTFISEWHVDHGVAQATDVAMSTRSNRVALKGGLDFVNQSFQDATVAVIDRQGCAVVEQKVRGSFSHPDVGEPNIISSLAGPALHLLDKARHLVGGPLAGGHCQVFYAGALPPPPADAAQ